LTVFASLTAELFKPPRSIGRKQAEYIQPGFRDDPVECPDLIADAGHGHETGFFVYLRLRNQFLRRLNSIFQRSGISPGSGRQSWSVAAMVCASSSAVGCSPTGTAKGSSH